jgi:hypothetical protein
MRRALRKGAQCKQQACDRSGAFRRICYPSRVGVLTTVALVVAALVAVPFLAHQLRRRRAEEQPFPPARLVDAAPPKARRRSRLEDRALFVTRASAVVALAVLGASPFVRCSRLSLQRSGGASVAMAIVLDDSMSMQADAAGRSRFERARRGAHELLASAREGDAVALVLAGNPARVALGATTDMEAARLAIDSFTPSDRATDLDGSLVLAADLLTPLPQVDRRVVVLSDLADGHSEGTPLAPPMSVPLWVALPELSVDRADCGVLRADKKGARVRVAVACGPTHSAVGRDVIVEDAKGNELGRGTVSSAPNADVTVVLPSSEARAERARLSGIDAIASDDTAPVVAEVGRQVIAVVADVGNEAVATGGPPLVERALGALKVDVDVAPVPATPDRVEDLSADLGLIIDDPPGLTPEQRHAVAAFIDGGGVVLLALGPHAAAAPLGATLEPIAMHPVSWKETRARGASPKNAGVLAGSEATLVDLSAPRRAALSPEDVGAFEPVVSWEDGALLVGRRAMGRGEAWIVTLPLSIDASDLALRPAFLALLDAWVRSARERSAPLRSDVGTSWGFPGAGQVLVQGPGGPVAMTRDGGMIRIVPPRIGAYRITVDGKSETRIAAPILRELDMRPRSTQPEATAPTVRDRRGSVDASGPVAIALLALVALELALRIVSRRQAEPT